MDGIQDTIDGLAKTFSTRMAAFEEELHKISPEKTASVNSVAADFKQFQSFVVASFSNILKQLSILTAECDNMEMRSRRKMLLFHGVPEAKDEDAVEVVINIASKHLRSMGLQPEHVSRAHRMGRSSSQKPRPILVKLCNVRMRDQIWFSKTSLKGTGVTMSEFLTKRRHRIFVAAREKLGVSKCWTSGGRIVALGADGKRHSVSSLDDLTQIQAESQPRSLDVPRGKPVGGGKATAGSSSGLKSRAKREPARK